jgi:hypothetical protein
MVEKRAALRFPTDLEANCRAPDRAWASRLRNISTSGCMITLPEGELSGEAPLRLRIKGVAAIDAEVVWQHRDHAGVRFRVPLHPAAMEHLGFVLPEGAWESAYRSAQPGGTPAQRRATPTPTPSRRVAASGLNGQLVKRIEPASELHG